MLGVVEIGEGLRYYLLELKDQAKGAEAGGCFLEFLHSRFINSTLGPVVIVLRDKRCYQLGEKRLLEIGVRNCLYFYCFFDDLAEDPAEPGKGLYSFLEARLDHLLLGFIQLVVELLERQLNYTLIISRQG